LFLREPTAKVLNERLDSELSREELSLSKRHGCTVNGVDTTKKLRKTKGGEERK